MIRGSQRLPFDSGIAFFYLLTAIPLVLGLGYALLYSFGIIGPLSEGFTGAYWAAILTDVAVWRSIIFSMTLAVCVVSTAAVLALILTVIGRHFLHRRWGRTLLFLPLAFPTIVWAFLIFQLWGKSGFVSRVSHQIGLIGSLKEFPDVVNDPYGIGIFMAYLCLATPFFTILFTTVYKSAGVAKLEQLAASLGAGTSAVLTKVTVPVLLKNARPTLVLYFLFVVSAYEIPLILGNQSTQMVSVLTINKLQRFNLADIPQAFGISVLYSLLVISILLLFFRSKRTA